MPESYLGKIHPPGDGGGLVGWFAGSLPSARRPLPQKRFTQFRLPDQTAAGTALVEGENILSAEGTKDESEQYSQYIVKSQGRGKHDGKGDAADAGVKRYRPLLILAEDQSQSPAARAKHEATMREGKADRAEIKVQSWRQGGDKGELWLPGLRVQVKAAHIHKDDDSLDRKSVV